MGAPNGNGVNTATPPAEEVPGILGQDFTSHVIASMGPKTDPRLRVVMKSLIQHMHDFAREIQLTTDEWMMAVAMMNACGQMSNAKRNEGQLFLDILGIESLVDNITYCQATASGNPVTATAILGPFWRADTPLRPNGSTMTFNTPADAQVVYMHGKVTSENGEPLPHAVVDVWQASTNGLYEQQDDEQIDCNLRGKFQADENGNYALYCIRPTPYPIPADGPAGRLLELLDRHPWRPAHIHVIAEAEGHKSLTTQIFDSESAYLDDDSVFAVKDGLRVRFVPRENDPQAKLELEYNISLAKEA